MTHPGSDERNTIVSDQGYNPPPPPPPGNYGPVGGYGAAPVTNQKAIWSLVLGILGLVCCGFFAGIPALILGKMAQGEIDASGGLQTGRGMATAGFILGIIACVFGILGIILWATGALHTSGSITTNP